MTNLDLLQFIGAADDKYIMESRRRPPKRPSKWPVVLAACVALVLMCGVAAIYLDPFANFAAGGSAEAADAAAQETVMESAAAEEAPAEAPAAAAPEAEAPAEEAQEEGTPEVPETEAGVPVHDIVQEAEPLGKLSDYNVTLLAEAEYPEAPGLEDTEGRSARWKENQVSSTTNYALNSFSYEIASRLFLDSGESGVFSPLSLYHSLAVLASGAREETMYEIVAALGQPDYYTLVEQTGKLYRVNNSDDEQDVLKIANSLWLDETDGAGNPVEFRQEWVLDVAANFYASVYGAEFSDPNTANALGAWIAEQTGGILQPRPELSADTVMALANTVWYESHWAEEFDPEKTETGDFTLESGEALQTEFMHTTVLSGDYIKGDDYTKSYLNLTQGKMIIAVPDEGVDVDTLLTEDRLWEVFENGSYDQAQVEWSVPKFTTDSSFALEDVLKDMGIELAFTENADFSDISKTTALYLGKVEQGAHIAVDEEGVEAAAYTVVGMEMAAEPDEDPEIVEMNLNRPFVYLITANDGSTAFMGVVRNPDA